MKTQKLHLTALLIALTVFVSCIVGNIPSVLPSSAATYSASNVFTATASDMIVSEANKDVQFVFSDNKGKVNYNRDLAYQWYTKGDNDAAPTANYFSMEFSFVEPTDFTKFTIKFQSVEYNKTADGVTENEIVFFNDNSAYSFAVRNNDEKDVEDSALTKTSLTSLSNLKIAFTSRNDGGEYGVSINGEEKGFFTNIGGAYADYSSGVTPLSFSAEVPENKSLKIDFKSLNGQSFALNAEGVVEDKTAPVLVLNEDIKNFVLGTKLLDFSYETIDVCDSTVTKSINYSQYDPDATGEPTYSTLTSTIRIFDKATYKTEGKEYVSIKFELNDDEANKETYHVAWYADDYATDVETKDGVDYLSVIKDKDAPVYVCIDTGANNKQTLNEDNQAYKDYVKAVDAAVEDLSAGDGHSFYLPALHELIQDVNTPYTSLSFTIYYKTDASSSTSTKSNLAYNALEIPLNSAGGYQFKVVASDKQGNVIDFYQNGRLIKVDSNNVWDIDAIPAFSFYVENNGLQVEEVEELSYAYMYSNYSVDKFEIKGLSGYETEYQLYYLDGVSFNDISYEDMVAFANYCHENEIEEKDFVTELLKFANKTDLKDVAINNIKDWDSDGPTDEDKDGWDEHDNRYEWKSSPLSFTPQENGYYIVSLKAADADVAGTVYAYQVVYAASEVDKAYGETYWIENNVVTIVFAVIAILSAIGAVVVWITMPSKETVENSKK